MELFHIQQARRSIIAFMGLILIATGVSADLIYDDFEGTPRTCTMGTAPVTTEAFFNLDLPGTAGITLARTYLSDNNFFQVYSKTSSLVQFQQKWMGLAYADELDPGQSWSDGNSTSINTWGNISALATTDGSTTWLRDDPTYIPFRFEDTTDSIIKYGYIKTSTALSGSGTSSVVTWTVYGYGYQTDGTEITTDAVPEPASAAMVLFGCGFIVLARRFYRRS